MEHEHETTTAWTDSVMMMTMRNTISRARRNLRSSCCGKKKRRFSKEKRLEMMTDLEHAMNMQIFKENPAGTYPQYENRSYT